MNYRNRWWLVIVLGMLIWVGAACDGSEDSPEEPSAVPTQEPSPSPTVILAAPTQTPGGPTLTPSPTLPPTVTAQPTNPAPAATSTPLPTDTPGPFEYVIQQGDFCIRIASKYGLSVDAISDIETLNNISCNALPGPGNTILVPVPTATPTVVGADLTQTVVATSAPPMLRLEDNPISVQSYAVQQGDTLVSISIDHDTSLRQLCELNPLPGGLDCSACVWESANCCCPRDRMPLLSVGQQLNVPAPSPTPTFTPTFSGSETATPTPTHAAPQPVYPPDGATIDGPVRLTWLTSGPLAADEAYLVTLENQTTGATFTQLTRSLSLDVPGMYLPQDGQSYQFVWQVSVVRQGEGEMLYPVSSAVSAQRFEWQG